MFDRSKYIIVNKILTNVSYTITIQIKTFISQLDGQISRVTR